MFMGQLKQPLFALYPNSVSVSKEGGTQVYDLYREEHDGHLALVNTHLLIPELCLKLYVCVCVCVRCVRMVCVMRVCVTRE